MSNEFATSAIAQDADTTAAILDANAAARATAGGKPVLTKEEKIAKIEADIARLTAKLDDVRNDRVTATPKAKKAEFIPQVGERVLATIGRKTKTTEPRVQEGVVKAIRLGEVDADGKRSQTQVKVEFGTGFDTQLVVLYPAQLVPAGDAQQANAEAAFEASAPGIAESDVLDTASPAFQTI